LKWSKQLQEEGKMPFLDVQILRTPHGIQTTVYRKPSASDRYTHFTTAQAWKEKIITITTLRQRAEIYCSTENLKLQEFQHLEQTFIANGYPPSIIHRYLYKNKPPTTTTTDADNNSNNFYVQCDPVKRNFLSAITPISASRISEKSWGHGCHVNVPRVHAATNSCVEVAQRCT
jgi:hypothetical protein